MKMYVVYVTKRQGDTNYEQEVARVASLEEAKEKLRTVKMSNPQWSCGYRLVDDS